MVVTTQVGQEAQARHDDVIIVRLAAERHRDSSVRQAHSHTLMEEETEGECRLLHAGNQEGQQLADVVGRVEDPSVVGQLLQHLQTLRHTWTQCHVK